MMTNLMTILERKVFISSNPRIVLSSCPPPCGHFSIQESATGGLSYKGKKSRQICISTNSPALFSLKSCLNQGNFNYYKCFSNNTSCTSGIPLNTVGTIPISLYPSFLYSPLAAAFLALVSIRSSGQPWLKA